MLNFKLYATFKKSLTHCGEINGFVCYFSGSFAKSFPSNVEKDFEHMSEACFFISMHGRVMNGYIRTIYSRLGLLQYHGERTVRLLQPLIVIPNKIWVKHFLACSLVFLRCIGIADILDEPHCKEDEFSIFSFSLLIMHLPQKNVTVNPSPEEGPIAIIFDFRAWRIQNNALVLLSVID